LLRDRNFSIEDRTSITFIMKKIRRITKYYHSHETSKEKNQNIIEDYCWNERNVV
jgi:hypothetical protein